MSYCAYDGGQPIRIDMTNLAKFAIDVMTQMRTVEPQHACCWNVCNITFGLALDPQFQYGGCDEDVTGPGSNYLVHHPKRIDEPKKSKKKPK